MLSIPAAIGYNRYLGAIPMLLLQGYKNFNAFKQSEKRYYPAKIRRL
jgi:hypothetical protein